MQVWDVIEPPQRCLCYGSHISSEVRRNDQDNRAHCCLTYDTAELSGGRTAAKQVSSKINPFEDPTRIQPTFNDLPEVFHGP